MRRQRKPIDLASLPAGQTEAQFQKTVIEYAQARGWKVAHFRKARTKKGWRTAVAANGKGFPDLLMVHPENRWTIAAELKVPPNELSEEQEDWISWLERGRTPAYWWYPKDWEEIEGVLTYGPDWEPKQAC